MKSAWAGLLLILSTVSAQTVPNDGSLDRLNQDLISLARLPEISKGSLIFNPLHLSPADRASLKDAVKDQSPALNGIMLRVATDAAERYDRYVVPWSLAYVLTSALAGKQLPEHEVKLLTASIVSSLDAAFACRNASRPLKNFPEFRASIKGAIDALLALGVSIENVQIVTENLIAAGESIVHPQESLFRPM